MEEKKLKLASAKINSRRKKYAAKFRGEKNMGMSQRLHS